MQTTGVVSFVFWTGGATGNQQWGLQSMISGWVSALPSQLTKLGKKEKTMSKTQGKRSHFAKGAFLADDPVKKAQHCPNIVKTS